MGILKRLTCNHTYEVFAQFPGKSGLRAVIYECVKCGHTIHIKLDKE